MIPIKKTTALIAALCLLGTVAPAAFADQVGNIFTDDDISALSNSAQIRQDATNVAINGTAASGQSAGIGQSNNNEDNDNVTQVAVQ